jgi:hypothetical protein
VSQNGAEPVDEMVDEAERLLGAAIEAGVALRLAGGLAIRRRHPAAARPPLARRYHDLDVAVTSKSDRKKITKLMHGLGYEPDQMFNTLNATQRLYFEHPANKRHIDVFVDSMRMCHTIDFRERLLFLDDTLSVTDLLLSKLQVVELNHKDVLDVLAILYDQSVVPGAPDRLDSTYLGAVWGDDWPLWRTCQLTLEKIRRLAPTVLEPEAVERVNANVDALESILSDGKKSMRWKLRARVGDRVRWYQLPDELNG